MASQRITFMADGVTCEGVFVRPDEVGQAPGIVVCHPHPLHGGDMENNVVRAVADAFAAAGFAVLRFNFRGVEVRGVSGKGLASREMPRLPWHG